MSATKKIQELQMAYCEDVRKARDAFLEKVRKEILIGSNIECAFGKYSQKGQTIQDAGTAAALTINKKSGVKIYVNLKRITVIEPA